ncbi:MAG: hypothetical protein KBG15_16460 [Kofleriaceae bacterium]|nr:hypothetical protein [Kofleriaceae bacterium]
MRHWVPRHRVAWVVWLVLGMAVGGVAEATPTTHTLALNQLRSVDSAQRSEAAATLRQLNTPPRPIRYWQRKLKAIKRGTPLANLLKATGGVSEGHMASSQSSTVIIRLDDNWSTVAHLDNKDRLREWGLLSQSARQVWVDPPAKYTGAWLTYFTNGVIAHDIDYLDGVYRRFTARFDNGQLASEQTYVDGKIDGSEHGFFRDGTKAYVIQHRAGASVGTWTHWHPNGQKASEQHFVDGLRHGHAYNWRADGSKATLFIYVAGKETGQAAWATDGVLQYAHGTAQAVVP